MNITEAKYIQSPFPDLTENVTIKFIEDGITRFCPVKEGNHYSNEIMRQVEAGELTIAEAD